MYNQIKCIRLNSPINAKIDTQLTSVEETWGKHVLKSVCSALSTFEASN